MFRHIVFMKFMDQASAKQIKQLLAELPNKIPQIVALEVGIDEFCSERSYDLVLSTTFDNLQDYEIYDTNPDHVAVKNQIKILQKSIHAVDYHVD